MQSSVPSKILKHEQDEFCPLRNITRGKREQSHLLGKIIKDSKEIMILERDI